ncbi:hypothetical protein [Maritimibacter dapengensis]|uniref:Tetratricopeptide repeat-like domain-containing protein n=1 Tax=Maritimibacter dapengensis TaxID=2836868 RepID=A0ABS6T3W1_9RHOB|nr:hypothetical protein [Maritimibacter dapengensis]MBV7379226.1 hypothetical protein [Maritimibacter dapengensis]
MSNPDSFIDEVTEEVRRDKLFALMRRWGWIGIVAVLIIVGGAAYVEWQAAREARSAQETGDAVLAAMEAPDPEARIAALEGVDAPGDARVVLALIQAAETQDPAQADGTLASITENEAYPVLYRDLAALKRVLVPNSTLSPDEKIAVLEPLTIAGGPFRVLAEEQMALAEIAAGNNDAALERLNALMNDAESTDGLRQRAEEMIVALGGTTE